MINSLEILKVTPPYEVKIKIYLPPNKLHSKSYYHAIHGLVMAPGEYMIRGKTSVSCDFPYSKNSSDSYTPLKVVEKLPNEQ